MKWIECIAIIVWMFLVTALLTGCTNVEYNPETRDFKFSSPPWGRQIGKVSVLREPDGSIIFEMEDYQTENVGAVVGAAVEAGIKSLK